VARSAPETKKRTVPGMRLARGVRMKLTYTKAMCRADALREESAGDPDCSAGCNGCENCTDYSAALNDARNNELRAAQELDELREQLACVRQALPEEWRNSVPSVAVSTLAAEIATLREQLARFTPLRAKGVVDADDNLDCWDTNPYEICTRHVAALNEKDPNAMWRVVDLFARDDG